jgi:hypothetical protein
MSTETIRAQAHAARGVGVIGRKFLDPQRDLATTRGSHRIVEMTVKDYLTQLKVFDGKTVRDLDSSVAASFQRGRLDIRTNAIKQRMLRDLLRGGSLPPLVLYDEGNGPQSSWKIIDGLQRTDVLHAALRAILEMESGTEVQPYVQRQLTEMRNLGQTMLNSDDFLLRPITVQIWTDLQPDELIRLFMVLNVGQQKVSPRHLLEVIQPELRRMFEEWGLSLSTFREEKEHPKLGRPKKKKEEEETPNEESSPAFRFEYLINGLVAYVTRDPQIKTSKVLQDDDSVFPDGLSERVTDIGSELCARDFQWVGIELNSYIRERYRSKSKWESFCQSSDNYFIPTMAAIGWARQQQKIGDQVEARQRELLQLLQDSESNDPLAFEIPNRGLGDIADTVKSNIGRKRRAIVFSAWRRFFLEGITNPEYPLDWELANFTD